MPWQVNCGTSDIRGTIDGERRQLAQRAMPFGSRRNVFVLFVHDGRQRSPEDDGEVPAEPTNC